MLLPASLCSFKWWTLLWRDFGLGKPLVLGTFDFEGLSNISIASGALFCLSPETWRPTILMVLNGTILKSPTEEDPTPTGKQEDSNTPQAPRILGSGQNMQILPVIIILSTYINYMASKRSTQRILGIRCGGDCLTDLEMNSKYGEFFPISISTKKLWKKNGTPLYIQSFTIPRDPITSWEW